MGFCCADYLLSVDLVNNSKKMWDCSLLTDSGTQCSSLAIERAPSVLLGVFTNPEFCSNGLAHLRPLSSTEREAVYRTMLLAVLHF